MKLTINQAATLMATGIDPLAYLDLAEPAPLEEWDHIRASLKDLLANPNQPEGPLVGGIEQIWQKLPNRTSLAFVTYEREQWLPILTEAKEFLVSCEAKRAEILTLRAQGRTSAEIAQAVGVSMGYVGHVIN